MSTGVACVALNLLDRVYDRLGLSWQMLAWTVSVTPTLPMMPGVKMIPDLAHESSVLPRCRSRTVSEHRCIVAFVSLLYSMLDMNCTY